MAATPQVSFILATYNRREITLDTLRRLFSAGGPSSGSFEVVVVDNASTDGTAGAIGSQYPQVTLLPEARNLGSCAKALGVDRAAGQYIVFLDDDSCPHPGSIDRMIEHFEANPRLGAAGFRVHLPDGREECSALPNVFVGCGVGFRAEALREVGGLDRAFFMQAEEYDLSFRLINSGWQVVTMDDLHVDHLKTACARRSSRTVYYDTRNNLLVAARYLPDWLYAECRRDWAQRYGWLARGDGRWGSYLLGSVTGRLLGVAQRSRHASRRLRPEAIETLFRFDEVERRMRGLASGGVRRVVFADLGKNVLTFHRAAEKAGVSVLAVGDDRFAATERRYRGVPVIPLRDALHLSADAAVISNTSPVHAEQRSAELLRATTLPVHCWFGRETAAQEPEMESMPPIGVADNTVAEEATAASR